ncbi:MAG: hypothetical protein IJ939_00845 [Clostridia bacterium]|nr:hypothetical protein [Clostridia bacterium]
MVKDTWLKDGKDWYFINADGYMLSNRFVP